MATGLSILRDSLAAAADEITTELAPGSVELRLRGRSPEFVVTAPPTKEAHRRALYRSDRLLRGEAEVGLRYGMREAQNR